MTTEYFGPLEDKGFGIGPTFNYDKFKRWLEGQQLNFKKSLTIQGDLTSANWDGDSPLSLATPDSAATAGFALDASEGSAQFTGKLFLGDDQQGVRFGDTSIGSVEFYSGGSLVGEISAAAGSLAFNGDEAAVSVAAGGVGNDLTLSALSADIHLRTDDQGTGEGTPGQVFLKELGSASAPVLSWVDDPNTGIYRAGADQLAFSTAGSQSFFIGTTRILMADGDQASPNAFISDPDTGIFREAANDISIATGGARKLRIATPGTGVNTRMYGINDTTTGSAANVVINGTTSLMARSTSSLKFKEGWQFADEDELAKLELPTPIVWLEEREDPENGTEVSLYLGFGTEHIYDMLPAATQDFDGSGNPENYDVRTLVAILSAKVKRLEAAAL